MAQTTKSLVRRRAHDITLAQQIHSACLVFHDLTGTNIPMITPSPSLDPKPLLNSSRKHSKKTAVLVIRCFAPAEEIISSSKALCQLPHCCISCTHTTRAAHTLSCTLYLMDIFHPGGPGGFVPDLLNPEEKAGFAKQQWSSRRAGVKGNDCAQPSHSGTSPA